MSHPTPKKTKPVAPQTAPAEAKPKSPTLRRLSLGGGNDGAGGQIYKVELHNLTLTSSEIAEATYQLA